MCTLNSGAGFKSWLLGGSVIALIGIISVMVYVTVKPDYKDNFAHVVQRFNIFASTQGDEESDVTEDEMNFEKSALKIRQK